MTRIAVSGHRGLSPMVEDLIGRAVENELTRAVPEGAELVGLSCLADGADQIFASALTDKVSIQGPPQLTSGTAVAIDARLLPTGASLACSHALGLYCGARMLVDVCG